MLIRNRVEAAARAGRDIDWDLLERQANGMMRFLLRVMTTVPLAGQGSLPRAWPGHPDPDDVPVWATAKLARAQYEISHDLRAFPPRMDGRHIYEGIEYLTAIEFVEDVLKVDAVAEYGRPLPPMGVIRSGRQA